MGMLRNSRATPGSIRKKMTIISKYNNASNSTPVVQLAANSPSIIFNNLLDSSPGYALQILNLQAANNSVNLIMQCSQDNGATFDTGANYQWGLNQTLFNTSSSNTPIGNSGDTSIQLMHGIGTNGYNVIDIFMSGFDVSYYPAIVFNGFQNVSGTFYSVTGAGIYTPVSIPIVNAIRLLMSSGNITQGTFTLKYN